MNSIPKVEQSMEVSTPAPLIKQEVTGKEETPRNCATRNGGFLQNAVGQDLVHLGVARTTSAGYTPVSNVLNTGHQRIKMDLDPASSSVEHFKTPELAKESGPQEDEKGEANMYDDRQHKRRKRTIMNDEQINEIEKALVDEPEMHKNTPLLQAWSEKLSVQGPEITASQLKNWLNNRKAKLARIAKERGVPYEGEIADKPSTPAPHLEYMGPVLGCARLAPTAPSLDFSRKDVITGMSCTLVSLTVVRRMNRRLTSLVCSGLPRKFQEECAPSCVRSPQKHKTLVHIDDNIHRVLACLHTVQVHVK